MEKQNTFNIRIYHIIFNEQNEILLSDEYLWGLNITKFPGGGLEWGEGISDCMHREAMEEYGQDVEPGEVFYVTDYFQDSIHHPEKQLIAMYYKAKFKDEIKFKISKKAYDFEKLEAGAIAFRWHKISDIKASELYFPTDKIVVEKLQNIFAHT